MRLIELYSENNHIVTDMTYVWWGGGGKGSRVQKSSVNDTRRSQTQGSQDQVSVQV